MTPNKLTLEPVPPTRPLAAWLGGKRMLARRLGERIAEIPHDTYVEPFLGMGGVFFRRRFRPKLEVINDLNGDIVNLMRIVRFHPDALSMELGHLQPGRQLFNELKSAPQIGLTDVQRAARFLYLQRLAFGGRLNGHYGVALGQALVGSFGIKTPARSLFTTAPHGLSTPIPMPRTWVELSWRPLTRQHSARCSASGQLPQKT